MCGRFRYPGFGTNAVSFRSTNYPTHYLAHAPFAKASAQAEVAIRKFDTKDAKTFAERAAWLYEKAECDSGEEEEEEDN